MHYNSNGNDWEQKNKTKNKKFKKMDRLIERSASWLPVNFTNKNIDLISIIPCQSARIIILLLICTEHKNLKRTRKQIQIVSIESYSIVHSYYYTIKDDNHRNRKIISANTFRLFFLFRINFVTSNIQNFNRHEREWLDWFGNKLSQWLNKKIRNVCRKNSVAEYFSASTKSARKCTNSGQ